MGRYGGLLIVWDKSVFLCSQMIAEDRFIAVKGNWKGVEGDIYLVNVYGPHTSEKIKNCGID